MRRWLVWLYPRKWRKRYEAEFVALLEEQRPTIHDLFDIIVGIADAYWFIWQSKQSEVPMVGRLSRSEFRILLCLLIGSTYVFRGILHSTVQLFGIDVLSLIGCLILLISLIVAYHLRKAVQSLHSI